MNRLLLLFLSSVGILLAQPKGLNLVGLTNTQALVYYMAPDDAPCTLTDTLASNDLNGSLFAGAQYDLSRSSTIVNGKARFVVIGARYRAFQDTNGLYRSRALPADTNDSLTVACTGGSSSLSFRTKNIPAGSTYSEFIPADPAHPGNVAWPEFVTGKRGEVVIDPQTGLQIARASLPQDQSFNTAAAASGAPASVPGGAGAWTIGSNYTYTGTGSGTPSWLFIPTPTPWLSASYAEAAASLDYLTLNTTMGCAPSCQIQYTLTLDGVSPVYPALIKTITLSNVPSAVALGDSSPPVPILKGWGVNQSYPVDHVMASKATTAGTFGVLLRKAAPTTETVTIAGSPTFNWGNSTEQQVFSSAAQDNAFVCSDSLVEDAAGDGNWGRVCSFTPGNYWVSETNFGDVRYLTAWGGHYPQVPGGAQCSGNTWDIHNASIQYCAIVNYSGRMQIWRFQYYGNFIDIPPGGSDAYGSYADIFGILRACNGTHSNTPCGDFTQLGDGYDLETQCRAFNPTVSAFKTPGGEWFNAGHMGPGSNAIQLMKLGGQNGTGIYCLFDPTPATGSARVAAARNTWDLWPSRYSGPHSITDTRSAYVLMAIDGVTSGSLTQGDHSDTPGYGPYRVKLMANMGGLTACPQKPAGSPIADWPDGYNVCVQVTVDGEPCDPSPSWSSNLNITNSANAVSGVMIGGGTISTGVVGAAFTINGDPTTYTFTGVDKSGTLMVSPAIPAAHYGTAITIFLEPADGGAHCGNANDFFLTASQSRDIFFTNSNGPGGTGDPSRYNGGNSSFGDNAEVFRLLCFSANCADRGPSKTWWLQSNYMNLPGGFQHTAWPGGQYLYAQSPVSLQGQTILDQWDYASDPTAVNESSNILNFVPPGGHSFTTSIIAAGFSKFYGCGGVQAGPGTPASPSVCDACPGGIGAFPNWTGAGIYNECISSRMGAPTFIGAPVYYQMFQPPFAGLIGCCRSGATGSTDSHPGWYQATAAANEQRWYNLPVSFSGQDHITGSVAHPLSLVTGSTQLYKSSAADITSDRGCASWSVCLNYLHLSDQIRSAWAVPLVDISGPNSQIPLDATGGYQMCTALLNDECRSGSTAGDLFINAPNTKEAYCDEPSIAQNDADKRDICVSFNSTYIAGLGQMDAGRSNVYGETSRNLGHLLTRTRVFSAFYNVRSTSTGALGYGQARFTNQMRDELLVWKIPPFPFGDSVWRGDFVPVTVPVSVPPGRGIDNVIAEFGYLEYGSSFYCSTNRQENCQKGNQTGNGWSWASEAPDGLPCSASCSIAIPALPGRILYQHILYRSGNTIVMTGPTQVVSTP